MSEKQNPYEILGVERDASRDEIRKVYRKLARQFHPDLNPGDEKAEARFKAIATAWAVLSDAQKRSDYDEFGEVALEAGFDAEEARRVRDQFGARFGQGPEPDWHGVPHDEFHFADIDDLLGRMFGQGQTHGAGRAGAAALRGQDLEASLELTFLEAVEGCEKRLQLGFEPGADAAASRSIKVRIPPGVSEDGRLRIPGKGGPGHGGGPNGDLWVNVVVAPHAFFERKGKNLELTLPISVREATLGAAVDVPTLDGRATLKVPAGSDSGTRLRLRGKGVPGRSGSATGDLIVRLEIKVPKNLDEADRAAIEALEVFESDALRGEFFA